MKTKIILFVLVCALFLPSFVLAANPCSRDAINSSSNATSALPRCVNQIYVWSLGVGALLALLMTVIGGYKYMTASGNAEQSSGGVEMMWGAVIGLALLFGSYLLLRTINPDLVNFNLNSVSCLDKPTDLKCIK